MKQIYNFITKYKKEIIVILILIIISIGVYYFYTKNNYEGFFTTTTPIIVPEWTQLGDAILGAAADDGSGYSVSLSSDGKIVAIGAIANDGNGSNSGRVRVYQYNEDDINNRKWEQLGQDIDGETADDGSGYSVSLSSDGKIVAIGAPYNDNDNSADSGHVRVFKCNEDDINNIKWEQLGDAIPGKAAGDQSGYSVSLSSDGKIVAIGTPYNNDNGTKSGHVRVYQYNEDDINNRKWEQLGDAIPGEAAGDRSGWSVSLSSDGKIVAIGAINNNDGGDKSGHVRVFKYNKDGKNDVQWEQLGDAIPGEAADDRSGWSVSLSSDGKIVAIGAIYNDGGGDKSGHVRVFKCNEDDINNRKWEQLGDAIPGEAADDQSGWSVSLSSDGKIVAIGARFNDGGGYKSGHVRVYQYNEDDINNRKWKQLGQDIDGEAIDDWNGHSVSLSSDGMIFAIGAYYNDDNGDTSGHVKIYKITPIDCVGEYQNSGECVANDPNLNCGPGTQQQEYRISQSAEHGGVCPNENKTRSISCNLDPCPIDCVGSFGEYGTCSKDCVGGTHSRTYTITKDAQHEGAQCPHPDGYVDEKDCNNNILCPIDCVGEFVPFKDCSRECGGGMFQEIYNITTEAQHGGRSCSNKQNDLKTSDCNMDPCPTYPINTTLQEALKESNNKIQNIRYNIIDRQEKLDTLTNKFNRLNKNISKIKTTSNYIPDDKTLTFY